MGFPGRPDIVFPKARVAVFIDGCFWHGCPEHGVKPKTNGPFWLAKLAKNKARDERIVAALTAEGWTVMRFWEHEIENDAAKVARLVVRAVRKSGKRGTQTISRNCRRLNLLVDAVQKVAGAATTPSPHLFGPLS